MSDYEIAKAATLAYAAEKHGDIPSSFPGWDGFVFSNAKTDIHGLCMRKGDTVCVSFRGTTSLKNWLSDISAEQVSTPNLSSAYKVHKGFQDSFNSVTENVESWLIAQGNNLELIVTGHSLGAALAILGAVKYDAKGYARKGVTCVNFGQPRVGNKAWAKMVSLKRYERIVHAEDIVPRVPWLLNRYHHAGTERWFVTNFIELDNPPIIAKLIGDAAGIYAQYRLGNYTSIITDHPMCKYLALIKPS